MRRSVSRPSIREAARRYRGRSSARQPDLAPAAARSPRRRRWEVRARRRARPRSRPAPSSSGDRKSCALDRPLGQELRYLMLLQLDVHTVRDLDGQELLADRRDLAENAARGGNLVALRDLREHLALLLGALVLRPDEQEIE